MAQTIFMHATRLRPFVCLHSFLSLKLRTRSPEMAAARRMRAYREPVLSRHEAGSSSQVQFECVMDADGFWSILSSALFIEESKILTQEGLSKESKRLNQLFYSLELRLISPHPLRN